MNLSSIKPNFSASAVANTLVLRDANNRMVGKASELHPDGIHTMTAATTLADADELLVWEASTSTLKRITKSAFNLSMNTNNPVARWSGISGAHALQYEYGGSSNNTSWASTSGGNIQILQAGTYRAVIGHGNSYLTGYMASGTAEIRFVQKTPSAGTLVAVRAGIGSGQSIFTACNGSGELSCTFTAAANATFALEHAAVSGSAVYGGGGYVEIEKLS
jgi:hypothetical protein